MQTTYDAMMRFADAWIAAWNRRDVEAVLAHYAEDARFVSPVARAVVGRAVLCNKQELAGYWRGAVRRGDLRPVHSPHGAKGNAGMQSGLRFAPSGLHCHPLSSAAAR
jgi:hypothetical protein